MAGDEIKEGDGLLAGLLGGIQGQFETRIHYNVVNIHSESWLFSPQFKVGNGDEDALKPPRIDSEAVKHILPFCCRSAPSLEVLTFFWSTTRPFHWSRGTD